MRPGCWLRVGFGFGPFPKGDPPARAGLERATGSATVGTATASTATTILMVRISILQRNTKKGVEVLRALWFSLQFTLYRQTTPMVGCGVAVR